MTVVRKHLCTEDRNRESEDRNGEPGDRNASTGCSEYDVLAVFDVVSGDRNEEGQMFGRVGWSCTLYRKRPEK